MSAIAKVFEPDWEELNLSPAVAVVVVLAMVVIVLEHQHLPRPRPVAIGQTRGMAIEPVQDGSCLGSIENGVVTGVLCAIFGLIADALYPPVGGTRGLRAAPKRSQTAPARRHLNDR